jgi:hypothetical protein
MPKVYLLGPRHGGNKRAFRGGSLSTDSTGIVSWVMSAFPDSGAGTYVGSGALVRESSEVVCHGPRIVNRDRRDMSYGHEIHAGHA